MGTMKIKDIMARDLVTIEPLATLGDALEAMTQFHVRHLLVLKEGKLVGLVTDRDVRFALPSRLAALDPAARESLIRGMTIDKVCIKNPFTVSPDMEVREAAVLMRTRKIGCLPVIDGKDLVGIVTVTDLMGAFIEMTRD